MGELELRIREEVEHRKNLPGISNMLGLDVVNVDEQAQEIVTVFTAAPWAENVSGVVHGGVITSVIDSSMGIFCRGISYPRRGPTINLNVNFLRPVSMGRQMYTRVKLLRRGRNLLWFQAESWSDSPDKPCASAEGTFYVSDT